MIFRGVILKFTRKESKMNTSFLFKAIVTAILFLVSVAIFIATIFIFSYLDEFFGFYISIIICISFLTLGIFKLVSIFTRSIKGFNNCENCRNERFIHHQHPMKAKGVIMSSTPCPKCNRGGQKYKLEETNFRVIENDRIG